MRTFASLAFAAAFTLAGMGAAQAQNTPRLVLDPEKPAIERTGWTYIGMADGVVIYMKDALPVAGQNGARRMLTAFEVLAPQEREGFSFRSIESVGEFDCINARSRVLRETYYEQASLKGRSVSTRQKTNPDWDEAIDGSVGLMRMIYACRDRPTA